MSNTRQDLLGLPLPALHGALEGVVDRPFRARQVYAWLHRRKVADFEEMTDLSAALRKNLAERFTISRPGIASSRPSQDGTVKVLFEMEDGASIEAVDIPEGHRRTFCISSQAGCPLGCKFCVTGYWGAGRDLSAGEIVAQVYSLLRQEDSRLLQPGGQELAGKQLGGINLVFMGMGEPLLNAEAVKVALELLAETISWRRMTLSTVGILPALAEMMTWPRRPNLAISLHAPDDERRTKIMPVNKNYPLKELMELLRRYPLEKGRRITFEYILIRGFNDQPEAADSLAHLLRGMKAKVNLIPLNPDPVLGEAMRPPAVGAVVAFQERLKEKGIVTTVRRQRGDEVSGACGQLRAFGRSPRGFKTPTAL